MKNNIGIGIMTLLTIIIIILTLNLFSSKEQINTLYDNLSETSKERNIFKKNVDSLRKDYKAAIHVYQAALSLSQNQKNMTEARHHLSKNKLEELQSIENILHSDVERLYLMNIDLTEYQEKYANIHKELQNIANEITEEEHNEKELLLKNQIQALKKEVKETIKEEEQEEKVGRRLNQELLAQQQEIKNLGKQLEDSEKATADLKLEIESMGDEHSKMKKKLLEKIESLEKQNNLFKKNLANSILLVPALYVDKKSIKRNSKIKMILPFTPELREKLFAPIDGTSITNTKITVKLYDKGANIDDFLFKKEETISSTDNELHSTLNNRKIKQNNTYDIRFFDSNGNNITKDTYSRFQYNKDCSITKIN